MHSAKLPSSVVLLAICALLASHAEPVRLGFHPTPDGMALSWEPAAGALTGPAEFRVEESEDLVNWQLHSRVILEKGRSTPWRAEFQKESPQAFFRVVSRFDVDLVREEGAEALGYDGTFHEILERIGQITPREFADAYADETDYLSEMSWDPTDAAFFEAFNAPPEPSWLPEFTLNEEELAAYKQNGFVVSTRLGADSFSDLYYYLFVRDLPVYVTADSILHAWHKSFAGMLEQLEDAYLYTLLTEILDGMAAALPALAQELNAEAWQVSLCDADYYLGMARTLLSGTNTPTHLPQEQLISDTLAAIEAGEIIPFNLFGRLDQNHDYLFDFSQFKVRGHYDSSLRLQRYFQAMIWCGRVDLRVAGNPDESSPRELATALVLSGLLERAGQAENWARFDEVIQKFVGIKDSMDPRQMANIRALAGVNALAEITSLDQLNVIQTAIEDGSYGIQQVLGDIYESPFNQDQIWLPRSFTLAGQRFAVDAWALGKLVFDRIFWDEDGIPTVYDKVTRRRASGLDVAFSVLRNDLPVPEIVHRIENPSAQIYRDGYFYQHNLAAVRETVEQQAPDSWDSSIYNQWLGALRELSAPQTSANQPESMRTRAWALRRMNAQLASWTQLRHDTVLYVKQTYNGHILCFYPAGFVEPLPRFWNQMQQLSQGASELISSLPMEGQVPWQARAGVETTGQIDLGQIKSNQVHFLTRFSETMATLESMAEKELIQAPFSDAEQAFIENLVEDVWAYAGLRTYTGWYPSLFYRSNEGVDHVTANALDATGDGPDTHQSSKPVALVTDILTAPRDAWSGDPGAVVHQAAGQPAFMLVAVDNGPDRMAFGGPVFTYYEFDRRLNDRLTDSEWRQMLNDRQTPPLPEWTRGWLVER